MPKKLTAVGIAQYKAGKARREIRDSLAPSLYLIIQPKPTGAKSWALRFRRPNGQQAKLTLGVVDLTGETRDDPVIGGALTVGQARELASRISRERARGLDVVEEHKVAQARNRAVALDRATNTFASCAREFVIAYRTRKHKQRPRRWHEDAALLGLGYSRRHTDPAVTEPELIPGGLADIWRDKPVADIDGHDIHGAIVEARKGSDGRGRKLHVALSALFRWLLEQRRVASNPAHGVARPGPPPDRERVLSDAEIVTFWQACDRLGPPYDALFKLLLLTGCRLREAACMTRGELTGGTWTIPGDRTKNHRALSLPLPSSLLQTIAAVPVIGDGDYVFSNNGTRPVSNFSQAKTRLDAAMAEVAGHAIPEFRLHDLRRTFVSGLAQLGVALPVIERLVNHVSGSFGGVVGTYQKHEYTAEKAEALARWAQHVHGLIEQPANVVALKKPLRRRSRP